MDNSKIGLVTGGFYTNTKQPGTLAFIFHPNIKANT